MQNTLPIRVLLPFKFAVKFLKTKFLSNSREYGIETLLVVSWVNRSRKFLVLRRPCKSPARSSAVPTNDTLICQ